MRKFNDYLYTTNIDNDFFYEFDWGLQMKKKVYLS